MAHYLKRWADCYKCTGEVKGGTVGLVHKTFVVTSNYTPSQLWPNDLTLQQAVQRRFKMIEIL